MLPDFETGSEGVESGRPPGLIHQAGGPRLFDQTKSRCEVGLRDWECARQESARRVESNRSPAALGIGKNTILTLKAAAPLFAAMVDCVAAARA